MNFEKHSVVETRLAASPSASTESLAWSKETGQAPSLHETFLPLRELEALSCALLAVLLAFFGPRITRHHALGFELFAQLGIE
jgi:lipopolysaccharide export LptBFGC system permease protein LptF